ncbi:MAG: hypothetical protein O7F73_17095 [Gammaproteobacteria bacterium]|nr:hypothetical protein [Gammaproteobacteria bacterium]
MDLDSHAYADASLGQLRWIDIHHSEASKGEAVDILRALRSFLTRDA